MIIRAFFLILLICLLAHNARAQEKICTQMGCIDGLILRPDENMLAQPGRYEIRVFLDERNQTQVVCNGALPLKPCDQGASFSCSSNKVRIGEVGCALPEEQHRIGDIYIFDTPRKVIMVAKRDETPVLARTLRPKYIFTRPNGPGCDPQCVNSTVMLGKNP